jgi:hypothetical protein
VTQFYKVSVTKVYIQVTIEDECCFNPLTLAITVRLVKYIGGHWAQKDIGFIG